MSPSPSLLKAIESLIVEYEEKRTEGEMGGGGVSL